MTNKEIKKLSRAQLLEMLLLQTEKVEQLEKELDELKKQLDERKLMLEKTGSIAEAALKLNGVFKAAQEAADQYLENAISSYQELDKLHIATQEKCDKMLIETKKQCEDMKSECVTKCKLMQKETVRRCNKIIQETKTEMAIRRQN